ncbi:palmitoyltransferase ZDHHC6-like isoform X1 [Anthonomus grandis grandis]|uniref:palmitoyltransferase ZDHHC6-like isoform X1 n=1 Tax=Anthonomus grandis grandis TaxID=2921223 RepID=UPI002165039C|nr:palmitoyltransferase ZDHHC6-like isoform X1 [Anthonomus grandis grandis]
MCYGPFKKLCHWGPLTAIGIIKMVTGSTIHCSGMWWPSTTLGGFINTLGFMSLSGLTLYNLLSAMFHGPGYLPLKWTPADKANCKYLQECKVCLGYKAPRSHHCRKCGRCVQKMDHHCPWINNCVGWGNHAHFLYFLLFATLGCAHASVVLGCSLYRALYRNNYLYYRVPDVPIVYLGLTGMILTVLSLGLAIGVVCAVGLLFIVQFRSILRNRTGIEDWIVEKADCRRKHKEPYIFPYDLGRWRNLKQVLTLSGNPVGDGINWEVKEGCSQFSLTIEQLEQKNEKRLKARTYKIVSPASGRWFPLSYGIKVCCNFPCTDEPRLKLNVGDLVLVTRWRKLWLFGEKIQDDLPDDQKALLRQKGWFPRPCAVQYETERSVQKSNGKNKKI